MLIPRSLRRRPGFAATVILTLAVAVSTVTVMATVVKKVLIDRPPFAHPDQLVLLTHHYSRLSDTRNRVPAPDVAEFTTASRTLQEVAFFNGVLDANVVEGERAFHAGVAATTANLFRVLQSPVAIGRAFRPGEGLIPVRVDADSAGVGTPAPIVLSHRFWAARFGSDSTVIGRRIFLDGRVAEVVGVLPATFLLRLPGDLGVDALRVDVWMPLPVPLTAFRRPERFQDQDSDNTGIAIGRLREGVTVAGAQRDLDRVANYQRGAYPQYREAGMRIVVEPLHRAAVQAARPLLTTLLLAAILVLLVASLNVAGLSLARAEERRSEMALRAAIGASDLHLLWLGWSETGLLVAVGGGLGLLGAVWLATGVQWIAPASLGIHELRLDPSMVASIVGLILVAATIAAVPPAMGALRSARANTLAQRAGSRPRRRVRSALVTGQVAVAFALMVFVGLLALSVNRLRSAPLGFQPDGAATFSIALRASDHLRGPAARAQFLWRLTQALGETSAVQAAGATAGLPLSGMRWRQPWSRSVPGLAESAARAVFRPVTSGYFQAMGIRLLAGRAFSADEDLNERRRVVIVDETFARELDPNGNVLGRTIAFPLDGDAVRAAIVGVVATVRHESLRDVGRPTIYVPYRQEASRDVSIVLRTAGDPRQLADVSTEIVRRLDPRLPVYGYQPLSAYLSRAVGRERLALVLVTAFGMLAGLMSVLGLYATVAYLVRRRIREFGVRIALGATGGRIARDVVAEGMSQVGLGVCAGAAVAVVASGPLRSLLYHVSFLDPGTWSLAVAVLAAASLAACYLPARRAAGVEPLEALRDE